MSSPRRILLFTCGWMITAADEDALRKVPAGAWKPGTGQDGMAEQDKDVAEITGLMSRAGNWPDGLRWITRRVKPSRRHLRNLTYCEKKTGRKYSITCTNIPDAGIAGVPGNRPPSTSTWSTASTPSSRRTASAPRNRWACGTCRRRPGRSNCGWVIAADIATDLTAWNRLLGFHDAPDLKDAEPDTLRYRGLAPPCPPRASRPAAGPEDKPGLALERRVPHLLAAAVCPASTRLTSINYLGDTKGAASGAVGASAHPGTPGKHGLRPHQQRTDITPETGQQHNQ